MHPVLKAMEPIKYGFHIQGNQQTFKTRLGANTAKAILDGMKKWSYTNHLTASKHTKEMLTYTTKAGYVLIAIIAPLTSDIWDAYNQAELKAKQVVKPDKALQLRVAQIALNFD